MQILKNELDPSRVSTLCAGLHERATSVEGALPLRHLHLDCNPIGAEGAQILAGAMANTRSQWCYLTTLRLGYAQLGAAGATAVAAALRCNSSVTILDMPGNNLSQDGAKEMVSITLVNLGCLESSLFMYHSAAMFSSVLLLSVMRA